MIIQDVCIIEQQIKLKGDKDNNFRINREPIRNHHLPKMNKSSISKLPKDQEPASSEPRFRRSSSPKNPPLEGPPTPPFHHPMGCALAALGHPPSQMYPFSILPHFPFPPGFISSSSALTNAQLQSHAAIYNQGQMRLPLPPTRFENEPQYVNAKQYLRIVKMREKRQRQPERAKAIKKYKHESRHQHAIRRKRCQNGRFISGKDQNKSSEVQEEEIDGKDVSGSLDKVEIQKSEYKVVD